MHDVADQCNRPGPDKYDALREDARGKEIEVRNAARRDRIDLAHQLTEDDEPQDVVGYFR
jgi:hypothetical protein